MSDNAEIIVDIDATASEAKSLAKKVVAHLISRGIILKDVTDCTLSGDGHPPGPKAADSIEDDFFDGEGLAVVTHDDDGEERVYFYTAGNGVELRCDACGKTFEPGEPGDNYQEALQAWCAGDDNAPFACPYCKASRPLREWDGPFCEGFGRLGFEFWNWPPLKPDFVAEIAKLLGHRVRLVHQHI